MKRLMCSSGRAGVALMSVLMCCALVFFVPQPAGSQNIPVAVETLKGEDGSTWERVSEPGFGTRANLCIVSLCSFQERLYAITRNETSGFELWRTSDSDWEQVTVEGFTNGNFHIFKNNVIF